MFIYDIGEKIFNSLGKRDKVIIVSFAGALFINLATWLAVLLFFRKIGWSVSPEDFVILRYNIYFGISSFGQWYKLLFAPLVGFLVVLINLPFSLLSYLNYKIAAYILALSAVITNIAGLVAVLLLTYINS